ncbi:hypothetical protein SASPL_134230 [Salvia splendens]|uniref:Uncharacterized protein n=1 Tax=Salvia splendens TaxID=180675 RepID=A0A8X8X5P8_SALSN|nr:hypothetical protein SASPL_134230 [Salvia splendens]
MSEFTDSFHKLTSSIITQLIAFLQVKYDQAQISPLTTHPTTMLVALSSLVVYYVLYVMLLRSPKPGRLASITERFLVCSGYAAVSTVAAVVFPEGASPFLYAIFGSLSAVEVVFLFMNEAEIDIDIDIQEEEGSKFEVFKKRVCLCFEHVWSGLGKLAKFFQNEAP